MAINDVYEVSILQQDSGGENQVNVLHYKDVAVPGTGAHPENDLADIIDNHVLALFIALMSVKHFIRQIRVRRIYPTFHASFDYAVVNNQGTISGESYPPDQNIDISLRTEEYTRQGRGRNRWCGIPITYAKNGLLGATPASDWEVAATTALVGTQIGPTGYVFQCVVSNSDGTSAFPVVETAVRTQLKTIRSRTQKSHL